MRITTLTYVLCLCYGALSAQISTDRPGQSNSPATIPIGSLQLETGFLVSQIYSAEVYQMPSIQLRYGLTDRLEARAFGSYERVKFRPDVINAPDEGPSGIGNMQLGLKYNLGKSASGTWELALESNLIIPTEGVTPASYSNYGTISRLIVSQRLSDRAEIAHNLTFSHFGDDGSGSLIYSPFLSLTINRGTSLIIEPYVDILELGEESAFYFNGGIAHRISRLVQLDLTMGRGISNPTSYLSFGMSILFERGE